MAAGMVLAVVDGRTCVVWVMWWMGRWGDGGDGSGARRWWCVKMNDSIWLKENRGGGAGIGDSGMGEGAGRERRGKGKGL